LVFLTSSDVFQFKVEHLLKFVSQLFDLTVFLLYVLLTVCTNVLNGLSEPFDFLIFFDSNFLNSVPHNIFDSLFILNYLFKLSYLELVLLLFLVKLFLKDINFSPYIFDLFISKLDDSLHFALLCVLGFVLVMVELSLQVHDFGFPVGIFGLFLLDA